MENRYRIIVCDLEEKEVKIDKEISCFLGSYVTASEKKSVSDIYALGCADVTIERTEKMLKATKDAARKIKRRIIKEEIKEMFGDLGNGKTS
jgi:hypothetical protein